MDGKNIIRTQKKTYNYVFHHACILQAMKFINLQIKSYLNNLLNYQSSKKNIFEKSFDVSLE